MPVEKSPEHMRKISKVTKVALGILLICFLPLWLLDAWARKSVTVGPDEMLLVTSKKGAGLIDFTFDANHDISYKWRYKPLKGAELQGAEDLTSTTEMEDPDMAMVMMAGAVIAGPVRLGWSLPADTASGAISLDYNSWRMGAEVRPDADFDSYPLGSEAQAGV